MKFSEKEIEEMKKFVKHLNSKKDSVVIVEGKYDSIALRKLGFSGKILEFHSFKGIVIFSDSVAKYKNIILLDDDCIPDKNFLKIYLNDFKEIMDNLNLPYPKKLDISLPANMKC